MKNRVQELVKESSPSKEARAAYLESFKICSYMARHHIPLKVEDLALWQQKLSGKGAGPGGELPIDRINLIINDLGNDRSFAHICESLAEIYYSLSHHQDERLPQLVVNYALLWIGQPEMIFHSSDKDKLSGATLPFLRCFFADKVKEAVAFQGHSYIRNPDYDPDNASIPYTPLQERGEGIIVEWHSLNQKMKEWKGG